jgi:hypothetical protein
MFGFRRSQFLSTLRILLEGLNLLLNGLQFRPSGGMLDSHTSAS